MTSNINSFMKQTLEDIKKEQDKQQKVAKEIVLSAYTFITENSAVDKGLYKSSHLISYNENIPDAPSDVDIGRNDIQKSKMNRVKWRTGDKITISNSLPYATVLENIPNYSKQQRPFLYGRAERKAKNLLAIAKL